MEKNCFRRYSAIYSIHHHDLHTPQSTIKFPLHYHKLDFNSRDGCGEGEWVVQMVVMKAMAVVGMRVMKMIMIMVG